jgi:signal transduction histidine kinase
MTRRDWRRHTLAALIAVGGPGLVTLLALTDTDALIPGLLYALAVASAAAAGGVWAGLLAAACSFIPFDYFFTGATDSFGFSDDDVIALVVFLATGLGVGLIMEREKRARDAAARDRRRAEASVRAAERLQRAAEALSRAVSPEDVLDAVLTSGVAAAEARAGMIAQLSEDGTELIPIAWRGFSPELSDRWARFPVAGEYPMSEAVRTGEPVFISSREELDARYPTLAMGPDPTYANVCLPLIVDDVTIGGLVFSFGSDQEFDERRRALKVALARQAAQALQRARMFEAVREAEGRVSFLAEASELLSRSLEYEVQMQRLADIAVPHLADWCTVDVLNESGEVERVAVAHENPEEVAWGWEVHRRVPPRPDSLLGVPYVLRTGEAEFLPEVPRKLLATALESEPELAEILERVGVRSWICVPLKGHGRVLGALTLVGAESGRIFTNADLDLAKALASRATLAIENALLYREAERRADAARALTYVGDAVVLVDSDEVVRYWNRAAELLLQVGRDDALGARAADAVPGWDALTAHAVPADASTGKRARAVTVPVVVAGVELWLSVAAVNFGDGSVYALRDRTEERVLEQARTDFVATASHELRTPLAAVYGSVRTLQRDDAEIGDENRELLLSIIERETERLTEIVSQILLADQLGSDSFRVDAEACDLKLLTEEVVRAARVRAPKGIEVEVEAPPALPLVRGDEDKLRQVLVNLVENAIKYSPEGGNVVIRLEESNGNGRIVVRDRGIGIAAADQQRIFEKFTRLDPGLSRGVGGTGLGLYITRELIARMGGTISVDSVPGSGSTFIVELPVQT